MVLPKTPFQSTHGRVVCLLNQTLRAFLRQAASVEMGRLEFERFLDAQTKRQVSASSNSQALSALVFLYLELLDLPFEWLQQLARPKCPQRQPNVLTVEQVRRVFSLMSGQVLLKSQLIYGSGMRISECLTLRVRDRRPA